MQTTRPNISGVPRWLAITLGLIAVGGGLALPLVLPKPADPASLVSMPPVSSDEGKSSVPEVAKIDVGGSLIRLYVAAFVVLVVGVGAIWIYRRRLAAYTPATAEGQLEVLGVVRIDLRSQVVLVRARNQKLLAGIDGTGLKMLVPITPQSVAATLTQPQEPARAA